jgi:hypothetical protein
MANHLSGPNTHWKYRATRCAIPDCERTRTKGRSTCSLIGHAERGVSLYGLKPGMPQFLDDAGP